MSDARGGDSSLENLVGSCLSCNQMRGGTEGRAAMKAGGEATPWGRMTPENGRREKMFGLRKKGGP
jgi:hypothetical protein